MSPGKDLCNAISVFYLTRGFEDDHYWVAQEIDGALIEAPWRVERETDGYRLSHADSAALTTLVDELGAFATPEDAVKRLQRLLSETEQ